MKEERYEGLREAGREVRAGFPNKCLRIFRGTRQYVEAPKRAEEVYRAMISRFITLKLDEHGRNQSWQRT